MPLNSPSYSELPSAALSIEDIARWIDETLADQGPTLDAGHGFSGNDGGIGVEPAVDGRDLFHTLTQRLKLTPQ